MSTLGHQYDNSLVSNAFGFLRLPMNFQPYDLSLIHISEPTRPY